MRRWLGLGTVCLLLPMAAARADGDRHCGLTQIAGLKAEVSADGTVLIPVGLNGKPTLLMVDTGGFWSVLRGSLVSDQTQRNSGGVSLVGAGGGKMQQYVSLPQIELDQSVIKRADFFVGADSLSEDPRVGGTLGANILQDFDLEIDLGHGMVNLYKQDHCRGVVVYWDESDATRVPFDLDDHLMTVPVILDGKRLRALIDTGASDSVLSLKAAKSLFGLQPDSPGVAAAVNSSTLDGKGLQLYTHRFNTLQIGDITFTNPELTLGKDNLEEVNWDDLGNKAPDLVLGMHQLRLLHLYIAYGEGAIYASTLQGDALAAAKAGGKPVQMPARTSDPADRARARALVESAETHARKQEFDQALRDFDLAAQVAPDQAGIYFERGMMQSGRKDYPDAIADFSRGLELAPDQAPAYLDRSQIYLSSGDKDHALQDADKALQLDPKLKDAYVVRALVRLERSDNAGALPDLDQAVLLEPKAGLARSNRCVAHLRLRQYPAAFDDCNAVLSENPDDIDTLLNRATLYLNTHQYRDAVRDYSAALKLNPNLASALYGRGLARKAGGDAAGEADLAAARQQDPAVTQLFGKAP